MNTVTSQNKQILREIYSKKQTDLYKNRAAATQGIAPGKQIVSKVTYQQMKNVEDDAVQDNEDFVEVKADKIPLSSRENIYEISLIKEETKKAAKDIVEKNLIVKEERPTKQSIKRIKKKQSPRPDDYIFQLEKISRLEYENQIFILTAPIPKYAEMIPCLIRRHNKNPITYELILCENMRVLITAYRRPWNWTGNYLLSVDHEHPNLKNDGYIGKLRSNFFGSQYNIYATGDNPIKDRKSVV